MKSFKLLFDRRASRMVTAVALLAATVMPAAVPALVSAATVTERSVALSSSIKGTTADYTVTFKGVAANTGAFVVDFCTTAAIGTACIPATDIDTTNVDTSGTATVTPINTNKAVKVELASPVTSGNEVSVELTGITNPSAVGTFYARIVTYLDGTTNYSYADPDTLGTPQDDGAVALSITDGFDVSGSVLETLVFCATDNASTISTGCTGTLGLPNISLGTDGVLATTPSEGTIKTQISTNAAHGAVVSLKNSAAGGGLKRADAATSEITPLTVADDVIDTNAAKFGMKLAGIGAATGTVAAETGYSTSDFFLDYVSGDATGVTSTYGDPVYNTSGGPITDGTANMVFAANISPTTPAGNYSATLSLIATGTF